jgi:type II secretory pathway pseudopilin PulG
MLFAMSQEPGEARPGPLGARRRKSGGFTLLETLVAFVVLSIGILGYVALQFQSVNGRTFARSMNRASTAGIGSLEEMRTINFDQLTGSGTAYRFKDCAGDAAESDYQNGNAYRIEWTVGGWNAFTANCNSRLRELKTIYAIVRWKEKGIDYSMTLTTFERGFKTGDFS